MHPQLVAADDTFATFLFLVQVFVFAKVKENCG